MIIVKDMARKAIEKASNGKQTILYSQSGTPSVMNVIPKFNWSDIDPTWPATVFPAFTAGATALQEIFIGTYVSSMLNGEAASVPLAAPVTSISHDAAVALARGNGNGWHVISAIEWSAIALMCRKNGFVPDGNSWYGSSWENPSNKGTRVDGGIPGNNDGGTGSILAGSGPAEWRHDKTMFGISDLTGNIWELCIGLRVVGGELQVASNNNAAINSFDLGQTSTSWKAIDATTGAFITPTFTGSIATSDYVPTTVNSVRFSAVAAAGCITTASTFAKLTTTGIGSEAVRVLKGYGVLPMADDKYASSDIFSVNYSGERMAIKAGRWTSQVSAGIFATNVSDLRTSAVATNSFRLAYAAV